MADSGPIRYETRDHIAYVTLSRPDAMNAIDEPMLDALQTAIETAASDHGVKALVITGDGEVFCIGLDIDLLGRAFADTSYFRTVIERFKTLLLDVEALPFPVVAAVNGLARAGGFELMLASDLVVIADEARIADHHLSFGVVPGGGATQRATRKIGDQRAKELIFSARWVPGPETVTLGLALRSVPRKELDAAVEELVAPFRGWSRDCLGATKAAINGGRDLPLADALDVETKHFFRYLDEVPSSREGYTAYVEVREAELAVTGETDPLLATATFTTPTRQLDAALVASLVDLGGYTHPLFRDPAYLENTPFDRPPVPGQAVLLVMGGLIEASGQLDDSAIALLGFDQVEFVAPAFVGDSIEVTVRAVDAMPTSTGQRAVVRMNWLCRNQDGATVVDATARMLFRTSAG